MENEHRHKPKVKPTPQPSKRAKVPKIPVCHHCRKDRAPDSDLTPRSNTWAFGMIGVRFLFCSVECRDTYDDEVRAKRKEADEKEE